MDFKIIETPFQVTLVGFRGSIDQRGVPVIGKALMDALWREVRERGIKTTGINHWVYLPNSEMFTGVELVDPPARDIGAMERLDILVERYLRHVHRGPYTTLPQIWPALFALLKQQGESPICPHLEIYGHHHDDPAQSETTILIGLEQCRQSLP